jgi:hypothetical protein
MEKPKTHFQNLITETPDFVDTKNPIFYAYRGFLWELEHNFTEKIPGAEKSLSDLVAFMFDAFYKNVVNQGKAHIDTVELDKKLKERGEEIWFKS